METKAEIRKRILEIRKALTGEAVAAKSEAILQKVLKTPEYMEADNILLYADYNHEVMTRGIFEDAIMRKKRVYFPKADKLTNAMHFYQTVSVKQLEKGFHVQPSPCHMLQVIAVIAAVTDGRIFFGNHTDAFQIPFAEQRKRCVNGSLNPV